MGSTGGIGVVVTAAGAAVVDATVVSFVGCDDFVSKCFSVEGVIVLDVALDAYNLICLILIA